MATIADNLQKIIGIKKDIKDAINNKGVTVSDSDKFDTYASKIMEIKQGGGGDCDPDHYLEYEWKTNGVEDCQGDDKGYLYVPMVTLDGKEYELKNGPQRIQITEKDNEDCKCHQLKCTTIDEETYTIRKGTSASAYSNYDTGENNKTFYIYDSEEWQYPVYLLSNNTNLEKVIRLPKFDSALSMASMFYGCTNVEEINMEGLVSNKVTSINSMFSGCTKLKYIDMSTWDLSSIDSLATSIPVSNFAKDCSTLEYINMDGLDLTNIHYSIFNNAACKRFYSRNATLVNTQTFAAFPWYNLRSSLEYVDVSGSTFRQNSGTTVTQLFASMPNLTTLIASNVTFENATLVNNFFYQTPKLKKIDLSYMKFPNVEKITDLFSYADAMEELNLSGWNLDNVDFTYQAFGYSTKANFKVVYACDCSETTVEKIKTALKTNQSHVKVITCNDDDLSNRGVEFEINSDFVRKGSENIQNLASTVYTIEGDGDRNTISATYRTQIKINNAPNFFFFVKADAKLGDTLYLSELDTPFDKYYNNYRYVETDDNWRLVTYNNDGGEHTIYVDYIKAIYRDEYADAVCEIGIPD